MGYLGLLIVSYSIRLAWDANPPEDNVTHYTVYRDLDDGNYQSIGTTSNTLFEVTGLDEGFIYTYYVTASNACCESDRSNVVSYFVGSRFTFADGFFNSLVHTNHVYRLEGTENLKDWYLIDEFTATNQNYRIPLNPSKNKEFFRLKVIRDN